MNTLGTPGLNPMTCLSLYSWGHLPYEASLPYDDCRRAPCAAEEPDGALGASIGAAGENSGPASSEANRCGRLAFLGGSLLTPTSLRAALVKNRYFCERVTAT